MTPADVGGSSCPSLHPGKGWEYHPANGLAFSAMVAEDDAGILLPAQKLLTLKDFSWDDHHPKSVKNSWDQIICPRQSRNGVQGTQQVILQSCHHLQILLQWRFGPGFRQCSCNVSAESPSRGTAHICPGSHHQALCRTWGGWKIFIGSPPPPPLLAHMGHMRRWDPFCSPGTPPSKLVS